jgi:hypothetical protein
MVAAARALAAGWPFARIDFYNVNGRTVFSEITLCPGAGTCRFLPPEYDRRWSDEILLPRPQW